MAYPVDVFFDADVFELECFDVVVQLDKGGVEVSHYMVMGLGHCYCCCGVESSCI